MTSKIRKFTLIVLTCLYSSAAFSQECQNEGLSTVGAGGGSFEEPGDVINCAIATAPQGRTRVLLVYYLQFADVTMAGRANSQLNAYIDVKVGDQTLYHFEQVITPSTFPDGVDYTEDDELGRTWTYYKPLRVEKWIPLNGLAANSPVQVRLAAGGYQSGTPPVDADWLSVSATLLADIRLLLHESKYNFRPKDSTDGTVSATDIDAYPVYWAGFDFGAPWEEAIYFEKPSGKIKFTMSDISQLPGQSTNLGNSTLPDYKFSTDQEYGVFDILTDTSGTTRLMGGKVDYYDVPAASLKIASLDYGGKARLHAEFQADDGTTIIQADIDASQSAAPGGSPANPTCNCASLPYDADNDGMADSWEAQYGGNLDSVFDAEPGPSPTGTSPKGDGYTALDEYRGFHYLDRTSGVAVKHTRTDPAAVRDVYYFDPDGITRSGTEDLLQQILAPRTAPYLAFREVDRKLGSINGWVARRLNKNSSQVGREGFALMFRNKVQKPGTLGRVNSTVNNGSDPVEIDTTQVNGSASAIQMAPNVLRAQVIAHESGHKFGPRHPMRAGCCTYVQADEQNAATTVTMILFGMPQTLSKTVYVLYEGYWDVVLSGWQKPDLLATSDKEVEVADSTLIPPRDSGGTALHRLTLNKKIPSTATVWIQNQESRLMDWTPRTTNRSYADWDFSTADKSRICVHTRCYQ